MSMYVDPNILEGLTLPPITGVGYVQVYTNVKGCGSWGAQVVSKGHGKVLKHVKAKGGTTVGPLKLGITKVLMYREVVIKGPLMIPLCLSGKGSMNITRTYEHPKCFQWEFPLSLKGKVMSILSMTPEYTTEDIRELLNLHRLTIPELGEGIDYEVPGVMDNIRGQDRIKFHVLRSKVVGQTSEGMVRNWLVGIVEYNGYPCALFMNAYWDNYTNHPLRYILSSTAFREMVVYIKSLIFVPGDPDCLDDIYNTKPDLYNLQFRFRTESYTMVLDEPLTREALVDMDTNVSKFLSLYNAYKGV